LAELVSLRAGEELVRQGEPGDAAYVILKGNFEVQKQSGSSIVRIDTRRPGEMVGEIALISRAPRSASIIAKTDGEALRIPQQAFEKLLLSSAGAARQVLHWVVERLQQSEALLHQQEKMAALGTLSAGLAHELNNPASAALRSAARLQEVQTNWFDIAHKLEALAHADKQAGLLDDFVREASQHLRSSAEVDALEKIDRTERLQSWLESNGMEPAWELAPAMVRYGWTSDSLEILKRRWKDHRPLLNPAVQWVGAACLVMELSSDVLLAVERISQIVQAMKSYTYLDQAPLLEVDLHEGLESTLTILGYKLKQGISIKREYSPNLPRIKAYASELNQVWTNIIDNAIDAMQGKGMLTLKTSSREAAVEVEITDNGPGIPQEIQPRIFEPFFTTKPPGQGTGLGLHISHDIITNRHRGQLLVESKPGETRFRVILPLRFAESWP